MIWRRGYRWAGILASYFTSQGLIQGTSVLAGLLFVNYLPMDEFALYTLAASVIAFFTFVTDLGSTSSLLYFFNRTRQEDAQGLFAEYVGGVYGLRRLAFLIGALLVVTGFPLSARAQGFGWGGVALATAAILLTVFFQIEAALRVLTLRLLDRYSTSYRAEILGALTRLGAAGLLVALGGRVAGLAVGTAALAAVVTARRAAPGDVRAANDAAPQRRREVLRYLLPTLPSALYFSVQGPLVIWLAATFGGTRQIAEVGALGRLGVVMSLFSGLVGTVLLPRLAATREPSIYLRRYLQFGLMVSSMASILFVAASLFPDALLWVLGANYQGLHGEVRLVVAAASVSLLGAYLVGVNNARAWTRWQGLATLTLLAAQVTLVLLLPLGTSAGVLRFNLISALVATGTQVPVALLGFLRPALVQWR